ncbi:MAG: hypothetical protein HOC30_04290, partial [Candidatus Marinimicrobia bacterium]|nr:hypothetical protein [Candidatus Neomarinimicrobiota bacterium]
MTRFLKQSVIGIIVSITGLFAADIYVNISDVGDDYVDVYMVSTVDVGGLQFNLTDNPNAFDVAGASGGSAQSAGFLLSSNTDGLILGFSLTGSTIPAGEGLLLSIALNNFSEDYAQLILESLIFSDDSGGALDAEFDQEGGYADWGTPVVEDMAHLTMSDGTADAGSTGTVEISMENTMEIGGFQFTLVDDPDLVTLLSASITDRTAGFLLSTNEIGLVLGFSLSGATVAPGEGPIATLTFEAGVMGGVADMLFTNLILSDPDGNALEGTFDNGTFTVTGGQLEDPTITIDAPVDGATIVGNDINVSVSGQNMVDGDHYHGYVDGSLTGMYYTDDFTISGVDFGTHELTVTISDGFHVDYENASASQTISFTNIDIPPVDVTTLYMGSGDVLANESVDVDLSMTNPEEVIAGFQLQLNDFPNYMDITGIATTERTAAFSLTFNEQEDGSAIVVGFDLTAVGISAGAGPIMTMTYLSTSEYDTEVEISVNGNSSILSDPAGNAVEFESENGLIVVDGIEPPPLFEPTDLSATPGFQMANLIWIHPEPWEVVGYYIFRDGSMVGNSDLQNYADTGLETGVEYCYTVAAYNDFVVSEVSNEVCVVTLDEFFEPPQNLVATENGLEITLTWNVPDGVIVIDCDAEAPYPDNDPCYLFVIEIDPYCCDTAWDGLCEQEYQDCVGGDEAPEFDDELYQIHEDYAENNISNTRDLIGYEVYRDNQLLEFTEALEYVDTSDELWYLETYCYNVKAIYDEGNSGFSNTACAEPQLGEPSNLSASGEGDYVVLNWDAHPDDAQTSFYIYKDGEFLTDVTETTYEDHDTVHDVEYCYTVTAFYDGIGESPATDEACGMWSLCPPAYLATQEGDGYIDVTWDETSCGEEVYLQYDSGTLANAFYFYDTYELGYAHGTRFDVGTDFDVLAASLYILSEGDEYWPWPDATHGPVRVLVFDDNNGLPGNLLFEESAVPVDGWATVTPNLTGLSGAFHVIGSHEEGWTDLEGFGVDDGVNYADNMVTMQAGTWSTGDVLGYGGDYMTAGLINAYGQVQPMSFGNLPSNPFADMSVVESLPENLLGVENFNETHPSYYNSPTRELLGYDLWRDGQVIVEDIDPTVFSYHDDGLTNMQEYCYSMTANYTEGSSLPTEEVCDTPIPGYEPTNLVAEDLGGIIALAWAEPLPFDNPVLDYQVYRDGDLYDVATGLTYDDMDPVAGVTYCYTVTARYVSGESYPSNEACEVYYLDPPVGLWSTGFDELHAIELNWNEPGTVLCADELIDELPFFAEGTNVGMGDDFLVQGSQGEDYAYGFYVDDFMVIDITVCDPATDFDPKLEIFTTDIDCNETTTGNYNDDNTCQFSNLQSSLLGVQLNAGQYYIVVDGFGGQTGNYGITVTESGTGQEPAPIEDFIAYESEKTGNEISFDDWTWADGSNLNYNRELEGYNIYRDGDYLAFTEPDVFTYLDEYDSAMYDTEYCYIIRTLYTDGESVPSNESCSQWNLSVATNLTVSPVETWLELEWTAADYDVIEYNIYKDGEFLTSVGGTSYTDLDTEHDVEYCYYITVTHAVDGDIGESQPTETKCNMWELCPPANLAAEPSDRAVDLTWEEVACGEEVYLETGDGVLANAFYFYDTYELGYAHGMRFDIGASFDVLAASLYILSEGDAYWPWPDGTHGPVRVLIFDDNNGLPGNLLFDGEATAENGWATVYPDLTGLEGAFHVVGTHNEGWTDLEGFGVDGGVDTPDNMVTMQAGTWSTGDVLGYGGDYMISTLVWAQGGLQPMSFGDLPSDPFTDMSVVESLPEDLLALENSNESHPDYMPNATRDLLGYDMLRDGTAIAEGLDPSVYSYHDDGADIEGLVNNTEYCYTMIAHYTEGPSQPTNEVCTTPFVPAPTELVATPLLGQIHLDWMVPPEGGGEIFEYIVYRDGDFYDSSSTNSYDDNDTDPGIEYCYNVSALYDGGESAQTNESCAMWDVDAAASLTATGVDEQQAIHVEWMPPGSEVTLTVEILTDVFASETSWDLYSDDGEMIFNMQDALQNNITYTWDVVISPGTYTWTLYDSYGDGIYQPGYYTLAINGEVFAENYNFTGSVESVTFNTSDALLSVSNWNYLNPQPFEKGQDITDEMVANQELADPTIVVEPRNTRNLLSYELFRDGDFLASVAPDVLEYWDLYPSANNDTEYCYFVVAEYDEGTAEPSNTACAQWELSAPSNLVVEPSGSSLELMWDTAGSDDLIEYLIYKDGEFFTSTTETSYTDLETDHDVEYCYTVSGLYDIGESGSTDEDCGMWRLCPPGYLAADPGDQLINVTWDEVSCGEEVALQYDDGLLANAFYFYDTYELGYAHGIRFDVGTTFDVLSASIHILSEGDEYWPWPDGTHGPVRILVFDDNGGLPGNLLYEESVVSEDGWATINPDLTGLEDAFHVVGTHAEGWTDLEGFGVDGNVDHPNNMVTMQAGTWTTGDVLGYGGDYMMAALINAYGQIQPMSYSDLPVNPFEDFSQVASIENVNGQVGDESHPPFYVPADGSRELEFYSLFRDDEEIAVFTDLSTFNYLDDALNNMQEYCYTMSATYTEGESPLTDPVCATPIPGEPAFNLIALGTEDNIEVSWEGAPDALEYVVYRDGVELDRTNDHFYADDSAINDIEYCYFVTAQYISGESFPTNEMCAEWSLGEVVLWIETEGNGFIELNWTDPSGGGGGGGGNGETIEEAILITSVPYDDTQNTANFMDDYDEVCPYTGSLSPDVVYAWIASPGQYHVDICDSDYDTKLYIYDEDQNLIDCQDDTCSSPDGSSFRSDININITTAGWYYVVVDGYGSQAGTYNLSITDGFLLSEGHDNQPEKDDTIPYVELGHGGDIEPAEPRTESRELEGFFIFRDGDELTFVDDPDARAYVDMALVNGEEHCYTVLPMYNPEGPAGMSNEECGAADAGPMCPPEHFTVETVDGEDFAHLSWELPGDCDPGGGGDGNVLVTIMTDTWASETSWNIVDSSGSFVDGIEGGTLTDLTLYTWDIDLAGGAYTFNIIDSYGDGIYCSDNGYYQIDVNGTTIGGGPGVGCDFGAGMSHDFTTGGLLLSSSAFHFEPPIQGEKGQAEYDMSGTENVEVVVYVNETARTERLNGYNIYRDGEWIVEVDEYTTEYDDTHANGLTYDVEHCWYMVAIYDDGLSNLTEEICDTVVDPANIADLWFIGGTLEAGSSGTFDIELDNALNVAGFQFTVNNDPNLLSATDIAITDRTEGFVVEYNAQGDGSVIIVGFSLIGAEIEAGSGPILELTYEAGGGILSPTDVNISFSDVFLGGSMGELILTLGHDGNILVNPTGASELSVGNGTAELGGTTSIEISLTNEFDIAGFQFNLSFDPDIASLVNAFPTDRTDGWSVSGGPETGTIIGFSIMGVPIAPGEGPIVEVVVMGESEGIADACLGDIILSDMDGIQVPASIECGIFTVGGVVVVDAPVITDISAGSDQIDIDWTWEAPEDAPIDDDISNSRSTVDLSFESYVDGQLGIFMTNEIDVAGFQFNLDSDNGGYALNGVSGGTAADNGMLMSTNTGGLVLGFSLSGDVIPAGEGVLVYADVTFDGDEACFSLSAPIFSDEFGVAIDVDTGEEYCVGGVEVLGCTDPDAYNYDPEATVDDGSCVYEGCMDPDALNYDPDATIECDDCCEYPFEATFNVYRDGSWHDTVVGMYSYSDTGLGGGETYCYTVTAVLEDGTESDYSNEECATTSSDCAVDMYSNLPDPTGEFSLIIVSDVMGIEMGDCDEIGVFDANAILNEGNCETEIGELLVGSTVWTGEQASISAIGSLDYCAFGGDQFPGYVEDNPIVYRYYSAADGMEYAVEAEYTAGNGTFGQLITTAVLHIVTDVTQELTLNQFQNNKFSTYVQADDMTT